MLKRTVTIDLDCEDFENLSDEDLQCLAVKALSRSLRLKLVRHLSGIEKVRQVARSRGGDCLSTVFLGSRVKLEWICAKGHTWLSVPASICTGRWCPVCANERTRLPALSPEEYLSEMKQHAKSKGGTLLSKAYINTRSRLQWRCNFHHERWASASSMKQGSWCPYCAFIAHRKGGSNL